MALDYTALGKRISTFRNASGLTQEQFCEKLNVSRKHKGDESNFIRLRSLIL